MINHQPPKSITKFLEWICPEYLFEGIVGDLEEQFYDDLNYMSAKRAARRYWWGAIRFLHPEIILRNNSKFSIINTIMVSNYIKVAGRNLARHKLFSFINAFGLSIGIAFCLLIFLFIRDEQSFDQFHTNKDHIYRMEEMAFDTWEPNPEKPYNYSCYLQVALAPTLKQEVPQVKYAARFDHGLAIVSHQQKIFKEDVHYTDPDFFKMFSFEVLAGDKSKLLNDSYQAVITPEIANKYFGTSDVLGKTFLVDNQGEKEYTVVGVVAPAPNNSTFEFQILLPIQDRPYYERNLSNWNNFNTPTFVQLHSKADLSAFDDNLEKLVNKYMSDRLERAKKRVAIPEGATIFKYQYTALTDMHLNTQVTWNKSSNPQYSYILGGIAILILIIACINYISLSLTASAARKLEVGVRKAIGAQRSQLIQQFAIESVVLAFIAMIIGLLLMVLFLPAFNEFTNKKMELDVFLMVQMFGVCLGLSLFVGLLSGCYPAFFLSSFRPTQVLKGGFTTKMKAGFTRPLVVLQFALSAFLIISSVIMYQQMDYITNKDLGFDKSHVLVVPTQRGYNEESNKALAQFRNRLTQEPEVQKVAGTTLSFTQGWSRYGYRINEEQKSAYVFGVDPQYADLLDVEFIAGRNFDENIASDSTAIIVNEALVADMGWENPIEEHLNWREDSASLGSPIIGVVKNYNFLSLEHQIEPMFLSMNREEAGYLTQMLIKLSPGDLSEGIDKVKSIWLELAPDKPFEYSFLDDDIAKQYKAQQRWMSIMGLSTLFAILISCLGLFGLSGINAVNRTKEMGIRKVFGANLSNIFILLNRQYVVLALIAFALASPASWYVMHRWLGDFQYKIEVTWPIFAISMAVGIAIAIVTVSYHAFKSATLNPADTLKYE